jgi:hypothetical protein
MSSIKRKTIFGLEGRGSAASFACEGIGKRIAPRRQKKAIRIGWSMEPPPGVHDGMGISPSEIKEKWYYRE